MDFSFGYLFSSFVIGMFGFGFFLYGKKSGAILPLMVGIVLMIYPFFITNLWGMWAVGVGLMIVPFVPYILSRRL